MSRTRQKPNEITLYLFKMQTTDTSGHIENTWNAIPIRFKAEDLGTKSKDERDVLSGRVLQSQTVQSYRTTEQIEFTVGDNISEIPNVDQFDMATIVKVSSKPQNQRGARHNTHRVIVQTIEVS